MRLELMKATGFRSIGSEIALYLRPTLTCLIGANEHGKSNMLDALNLIDGGSFAKHDKNVKAKGTHVPYLEFSFLLGEEDRSTLLEEVEKLVTTWAEQPGSDDQAKALQAYRNAATWVKRTTAPKVKFELRSNGKRFVVIGNTTFAYSLQDSKGLSGWIDKYLPNVQLFDPPADLVDSITLPELKAKSNVPFVGLLKLAGVWEQIDLLFQGDNEAHRIKQQAGKSLTRRIRRVWTQGAAHTFRFDESGGRLHVSIEDPTTFDMPSRRSLGFKSFLSFYLSLYAQTDDMNPEGFLLLFDEPGIHLHPQGQKDLLRELRRLSNRNQIVYTTHSPFMIDRNDPAATILVRKGLKGADKGTRVLLKAYGDNWSAVNAALGISPADAMFPGDRILLVEGRSDHLYISRYMSLCQQQTKADLNALSIVDSEDREHMEDYVRLLLAADRELVVLTDGDQGGDELATRIKRVAGGRKNKVTVIDLRLLYGKGKNVSIEDFVVFKDWVSALQQYVTEILRSTAIIDVDRLRIMSGDRTLGRAAADYLKELGVLNSTRRFSKTTVADLYCRNRVERPDVDDLIGVLCQQITDKLGLAA